MDKPIECPQCGATAVDSCKLEQPKEEECIRN